MSKIIVIGGGAAGMMAAISASNNEQNEVILFEKNEKLGKKIYITGKGRCNVTNASDVDNLLQNTIGNKTFMYSSYYTFDSYSVMDFFEREGLTLKIERGRRVFPKSDKSSDVIKTLNQKLTKNNVKVFLNSTVKEILIEDNKISGVIVNNKKYTADKVIVATGGLSYSQTGSTGDGYSFAKKVGHTVNSLSPSLVPLTSSSKFIKELQGLSLKNVQLKIKLNNKEIYSNQGEMIFTHFGVSGPLVLTASRYLINQDLKNCVGVIDLKPALTDTELDKRILKDFEKYKNKDFKNSLNDLLPQKIIETIIALSCIDPYKKVNEITKVERKKLVDVIKNFTFNITGNKGYNQAIITAGGINVDEIDPSNCMSKIVDGLYFVGEVLDIDCLTGGYNMQVAFSTGYLAGLDC